MSEHHETPSPPATTYTARAPIAGPKLTCSRCGREYAYPAPGGQPVSCECGWHYRNVDGRVVEEFRSRIGA